MDCPLGRALLSSVQKCLSKQIQWRRRAAGTTHIGQSDYGYDQYAHLTSLDHKGPSPGLTLLTGYDWTFDHLNRVSGVDFVPAGYVGEDAVYSYDATDQLIGADRQTADESNVNDLNGNRRMSGTTNWVAGTNNQLFRDGTYEYTYDKEGNLTKRVTLVWNAGTSTWDATGATTEYAWDNRNRLTSITAKPSPGGSATKVLGYSYDAFDLRVAKSVDNTPVGSGTIDRYEYYVWDGDDIVMDFVDTDGAGGGASVALAKRYLWGQAVDQILAEETAGGATVWDLADNLGSVRDQMNNTGGFISASHVNFDAFGKPTATPVSRFAFTGQEWDADAGLYYYNARWYDPKTGKFLSPDPSEFDAGDTNLTRMVGNSVTNAVDPTGLKVYQFRRDLASSPLGAHGGLLIIPDDPAAFPAEVLAQYDIPNLRLLKFSNGELGFTLAGFCCSDEGDEEGRYKDLIVLANESGDVLAAEQMLSPNLYTSFWKADWDMQTEEVWPPTIQLSDEQFDVAMKTGEKFNTTMGDTEFIHRILQAAENYRLNEKAKNKVPYGLLAGELGGKGFNCNAFANSLLKAAGALGNNNVKHAIDAGAASRIPPEYFEPPKENEQKTNEREAPAEPKVDSLPNTPLGTPAVGFRPPGLPSPSRRR